MLPTQEHHTHEFSCSDRTDFLSVFSHHRTLAVFTGITLSHCVRPPVYWRLIGRQLVDFGYYSLTVVGLTTVFSGMVLALQSYSGFSGSMPRRYCNRRRSIPDERACACTCGLMVAGRIGASMAAEIGTMRVTEQVDALTTLSTNPFKYLVVPRVLAGIICLPFLVLIGDIIGVFGGFLVGVNKLGFNAGSYMKSTFDFLEPLDVISGLVKAAVFGFLIALMGCYHGYYSGRGANGVGRATTNAGFRLDPDTDFELSDHRTVLRPLSGRETLWPKTRRHRRKSGSGLTKSFASNHVLRGLDLDIADADPLS